MSPEVKKLIKLAEENEEVASRIVDFNLKGAQAFKERARELRRQANHLTEKEIN